VSEDSSVLLLGIETSCDETAAAVLRDGREVLASVVASQVPLHRKFGGVVPEVASRAHLGRILPVVEEALDRAQVSPEQLDAVAVTVRPGLIVSLLVGVSFAKALVLLWNKPLVAVDHLLAHIHACFFAHPTLVPPLVALVVSGGHTSLYLVEERTRATPLGATTDDAAGEAFDKVASILGLGYPGGPAIEQAAQGVDPTTIQFPRTLLGEESLDFSFSGIKTAVLYHCFGQNASERDRRQLLPEEQARVAAAFQEAVVEVLVEKCRRALLRTGLHRLAVSGGVAANGRLRQRLDEAARQEGWELFVPPRELCTDNAVMVAALGGELLREGEAAALEAAAEAEAGP
jgi:N6-L-threonylcarbamoyladenine synthase